MRRIVLCAVMILGCDRPRAAARDASVTQARATVDVPTVAEMAMPATAPAMEAASEADQRAFSAGIERLAWRLWPEMRARPGNRVFSPAAVAVALAMTVSVSRGSPAEEMRAALAPALDIDRFHRAAGTLLRGWQASVARDSGLRSAQRVFASRAMRFDDDVQARLLSVYGAPVGVVDTGAPEGARWRINDFVSAIGVPEAVPEYSVVAGAPAIVASGARARFACDGAASTLSFRVGGVSPVEARSVLSRDVILRARGEGFTLLRLPATGGSSTLDIVLPDEGIRLADFEARFDEPAMRAAIDGLRADRSLVNLPVMSVVNERAEGLRNVLMETANGSLFDPERSELAGTDGRGRWVSELFHRARLDLDLTPAAAESGRGGVRPTLAVDRPFLFVLRDRRLDAVLALGHVVDPRE